MICCAKLKANHFMQEKVLIEPRQIVTVQTYEREKERKDHCTVPKNTHTDLLQGKNTANILFYNFNYIKNFSMLSLSIS